MLDQNKIKVVKRQSLLTETPAEKYSRTLTRSREKAERKVSRQVNGWILDWREEKRRTELKNTALFFARNA